MSQVIYTKVAQRKTQRLQKQHQKCHMVLALHGNSAKCGHRAKTGNRNQTHRQRPTCCAPRAEESEKQSGALGPSFPVLSSRFCLLPRFFLFYSILRVLKTVLQHIWTVYAIVFCQAWRLYPYSFTILDSVKSHVVSSHMTTCLEVFIELVLILSNKSYTSNIFFFFYVLGVKV